MSLLLVPIARSPNDDASMRMVRNDVRMASQAATGNLVKLVNVLVYLTNCLRDSDREVECAMRAVPVEHILVGPL